MHCRVFAVLAVCMLAAAGCGSGSAPAAPARYTTMLELGPAPAAVASPARNVVLYDGQFVQPFTDVAVLVANVAPAPAQLPNVTWASSNSSVEVQSTEPHVVFDAPTAPPLGTYVGTGTALGKATVTAQVGPPVNESASIAVYHYASLSFGCGFRYQPAFDFDPGTGVHDTSSDLYATAPSDAIGIMDPCFNSVFLTPPGTAPLWHAPYGGVFLGPVPRSQFPAISPAQWKNAATQFTPAEGVLLFKTRSGAIVKAMLPVGPFEVSNASGAFPY